MRVRHINYGNHCKLFGLRIMKSTYNAIIHRICINQIFSTNINIYTQHEKIYIRENSVHKFNVQRKFQKLFHKR